MREQGPAYWLVKGKRAACAWREQSSWRTSNLQLLTTEPTSFNIQRPRSWSLLFNWTLLSHSMGTGLRVRAANRRIARRILERTALPVRSELVWSQLVLSLFIPRFCGQPKSFGLTVSRGRTLLFGRQRNAGCAS